MYKGKTNMIENGESEVRLVSAEVIEERIKHKASLHQDGQYYIRSADALKIIYDAPTIEPKQYYDKGYADAVQGIADAIIKQGKYIASDEPKQGEWKVVYDSKDSDLPMRMCSECGQKIPITARLNYCFECGAKMHHIGEATEMVNVCPTCGCSDYIRSFKDDFHIKNSEYRFKCINCNTYIK